MPQPVNSFRAFSESLSTAASTDELDPRNVIQGTGLLGELHFASLHLEGRTSLWLVTQIHYA